MKLLKSGKEEWELGVSVKVNVAKSKGVALEGEGNLLKRSVDAERGASAIALEGLRQSLTAEARMKDLEAQDLHKVWIIRL